MKCPCCGSEFRPNDAAVDLNTNTFVCATGNVKLTAQQAELAYTLIEAAPRIITYDMLMARLWGCSPPNAPYDVIKVQIKNLRRKIENHGYAIQATRERGYRFLNLNELPAYAA